MIDNRNLRNGQPASLNRQAHLNRPAHAPTVRQAHVAYRTQQETDYQSNNPDSYLSQPRNPQVREKIQISSKIKIKVTVHGSGYSSLNQNYSSQQEPKIHLSSHLIDNQRNPMAASVRLVQNNSRSIIYEDHRPEPSDGIQYIQTQSRSVFKV